MNIKFPRIGSRIVKSAICVFLCFLINEFRNGHGMPFYSAIGALWCLRPYVGTSKDMARQRMSGTVIGAIYGLLVITLEVSWLHIHGTFQGNIIIALGIVLVLYTTVLFKQTNASYFSCVVFLSITVSHITDGNPYFFVMNRVLDTLIGIAVGIGVNSFRMPRKKKKNTLFVSGLDDTLLHDQESLSAYSKVELNRMLSEGIKFTVATMRTPASLLDPLKDIKLNLPVIVMDGAVLYDMKEKECVHAYIISRELSQQVIDFVEGRGYHCFINTIVDDVLVIYYGDFHNIVERTIFHELKQSPYRNYVSKRFFYNENVVYLMMIDRQDKMQELYDSLKEAGYTERLKVLFYRSKKYPGYSYIKIYNKNASKKNMIHYLEEKIQVDKVVTFGSIPGAYDVLVEAGNDNKVVQSLKKIYEPYIWQK